MKWFVALFLLVSTAASARDYALFDNGFGEFKSAKYEDLYRKNSCERHSSYVQKFNGSYQDGVSISVSSLPALQSQIDQSYSRIFGSEEGRSIVQKVFYCSPTLMRFHLDLSPQVAEHMVKVACGNAQNFKTSEIRAAYQKSLADYIAAQGQSHDRNQGQACSSDDPGQIPVSDSLISAIAGFDPTQTESEISGPEPRCLAVKRISLKNSALESFTDPLRNVTTVFVDKDGKLDPNRLDHILLHEFGVVADAKGFMHFPAFFAATGLKPEAFSPSAQAVSKTISNPFIHDVLAGVRGKNLENHLLRKQESAPQISSLSDDKLRKANAACIQNIVEKGRFAFEHWKTDGMVTFRLGTQTIFDGKRSYDERQDLGKSREEAEEDFLRAISDLQQSQVEIQGKKVPLCVWMEVPEISGSNYLGNFGPDPNDGGGH